MMTSKFLQNAEFNLRPSDKQPVDNVCLFQDENSRAFGPHSFHLVDLSPWPLAASCNAFGVVTGLTLYMHNYIGALGFFEQSLFFLILTSGLWWRDVCREGAAEGHHTAIVERGLRMGMILFIVSEVMFFFAFFWAFFNAQVYPAVQVFYHWPPLGITPLSPWLIPLLNTILLLSSGASVTWAHHSITEREFGQAQQALMITIILAVVFTLFQYWEYKNAPFTISSCAYGSSFFMATGFHGFHVFIGTCFLTVCFFRLVNSHFTDTHHFGFEAAAWYWHFVDVVWLFLFIVIYWYGGETTMTAAF